MNFNDILHHLNLLLMACTYSKMHNATLSEEAFAEENAERDMPESLIGQSTYENMVYVAETILLAHSTYLTIMNNIKDYDDSEQDRIWREWIERITKTTHGIKNTLLCDYEINNKVVECLGLSLFTLKKVEKPFKPNEEKLKAMASQTISVVNDLLKER